MNVQVQLRVIALNLPLWLLVDLPREVLSLRSVSDMTFPAVMLHPVSLLGDPCR